MEDTETFKTIPLLDADMFKKQLKNYYVLFSQQQSTAKQSKKKKKEVDIEEKNSNIGIKSKKVTTISSENTFTQFKVSFHNTVNGIIDFNHDSKKYALEYNIYNPKTKKNYKEIIYLPIILDLYEIIKIVQSLKEEIFIEYTKAKIQTDSLQSDFDYLELTNLENELISISQNLNLDEIQKINSELESENELLIRYRSLYEKLNMQIQTDFEKNSIDKQNIMKEYLIVNQTLNHVLDANGNIIVYPGTRVLLNGKKGIIYEINNQLNQYHIQFDNSSDEKIILPIPKKITNIEGEFLILGSIRNLISNNKNRNTIQNINLSELMQKIENKQTLMDVLSVLNIDLSTSEITNRPRLEIYSNITKKFSKKINIIDKIQNFFTNFDLSDIFNNSDNIIIGNVKDTPNNMSIDLANWRQLFSMNNMSVPFKVDDFEFNSIKHYHIASQFYNREDLNINLKMQYNKFFFKFTNNFSETGSLSKIKPELLQFHIDNITYKKPLMWSMNTIHGDSLESLYLKKAYYQKFNNNVELKNALIKTYPKIIYEKIGKNKLYINYELMLVRYYLYKNIKPSFTSFNYNNGIYKYFIEQTTVKKDYEHKLLLNLFLIHNAYENREKLFINKEVLYIDYNRLDISGKTNEELITKYIHELLFSYNSVFIYELVYNYLQNDTITHKSIDGLIKKHNLYKDETKWIFYFYYDYITAVLNMKHQIMEHDILFEKNLEEQYRALQTTLKANNYLLVETAFRYNESFLDSIIEFLNRNKIKPFDLSSNKYSYSESSVFKNNIIIKKEFPIYKMANNYLYSLMNELYNINNSTDKTFDETDYFERLEILSTLLGLDIQIISEDAVDDILYIHSKDKYPNIIPEKMIKYEKTRGRVVLGHIPDTDYFFSTKPFIGSSEREIIKYLIAVKSQYIIQEETLETGEIIHTVIGKWDKENLELDTQDIETGDKLKGDIDIEDFIFYKLGDKIYYKDREVYF